MILCTKDEVIDLAIRVEVICSMCAHYLYVSVCGTLHEGGGAYFVRFESMSVADENRSSVLCVRRRHVCC